MTARSANPRLDEYEKLERERERVEAQLRTAPSPTVEAMLRAERGWIVRRRRALDRAEVSSRAALHLGGVTRPCEIRDVSAHGAGVDADAAPRVGDPAVLVLADLDGAPALNAVVRHVTGRRIGLEFVPHGEPAREAALLLARKFGIARG
jgi:hypothetical protein